MNSRDRFSIINGYQIEQQIYAGSRTFVYRGIRLADGLPVVLKMLRSDRPTSQDLLRLRNHYTIAKNLNFAGIVQPISLENHGNGLVLVMADEGYIALSDYILANHLSPIEVLAIALQLATILNELYLQRVIHKDIKPNNVLIAPNTKQVALTDFGLATLLPQETQSIANINILEGTLAYLAPEQTGRMNRGIDYRSDFYALGVTLFELFTGQLPFRSDDPLEIVHCHLAKPAPLVSEFKPEIPEAITQIVAKLMAKNAEDRYQSALGLKYDLEICLNQLNQTGTITPFGIGTRDLSDRFSIPEKLYGRAVEVKALLDAFDRFSNGSAEMILVAGFSGVGKTAVVNEVHKPIVRQRGYFIKGKFDQFQRNIPFFAFVQAFRDLMGQLSSESDAQLQTWKNQILEAIGKNGQVLIEMIPGLEYIIGNQPPAPELSGSAAQNRFNLLIQKFVQVFTTAEHPLVLFLDDLQWADLASLKLLKLLMQDTGHLLVLGAYRDNEVSPVHPFILAVDEIVKAGATVHTITLPPLSEAALNQLVADTLNCDLLSAQPLNELVYQKTKGNPFFSTQFLKALYEDSLIAFNWDTRSWYCDIVQARLTHADDVVEFMATQLQKLPVETQDVLKVAACIGEQFDLQTLAIASQQSPQDIAKALWQALQEGLIIPTTEAYKFYTQSELDSIFQADANANANYKFLHDRVQQAAYSLIPDDQKQSTHLAIARFLKQNTTDVELEANIFEIADHWNRAISLISDPSEKINLAQLNLIAGIKAKASIAYEPALKYFNTGLTLLSAQSWKNQLELMLTLHEGAAEVAYLCGDFAQMEHWVNAILAQPLSPLSYIKTYEIQIQAYSTQSQFPKAIAIARNALKQFNIHLPKQPTSADIVPAMQDIAALLNGRNAHDLLDLPVMTDAVSLASIQLLSSITPTCYNSAPLLFPFVVLAQVRLSIQAGNTAFSAFGYCVYAVLLGGALEDLDAAYEFGQLGLKLAEKYKVRTVQAKVNLIVGNFILHCKSYCQNSLPLLAEAFKIGLEVGDFENTGYSAANFCQFSYAVGQELAMLLAEIEIYINTLLKLKIVSANYCFAVLQTIQRLLSSQNQSVLTAQKELHHTLTISNDLTGLHLYWVYRLTASYLLNEIVEAKQDAAAARQTLASGASMISIPIFYFYDSLTALADFSEVTDETAVLDLVSANQAKLQHRAYHAPMNFQHKYDLVEAERYRVLGNKVEAIELYDRAISGAKENGYIQEEALANELAAKFYLDWDKEKIAQDYMINAYYCYVRWGAAAKVNDLEKRYPQLLSSLLQKARPTSFFKKPSSESAFAGSEVLDLASLLKASQAISEEIELDKLLATLLNIAIANAGADKCVLLQRVEQELQITAQVESGQKPQILSSPISLESSEDVAISLVNQVKHSLEPLVVNDARVDAQFAGDRYITQHQTKSILCTPILKQGQLIGILYLENNLTVGAFTSDRLEILNLLCSQAAISLENAQLYNSLEQKVVVRTQELTQALTELKARQQELIQSEKMAALGQLIASIAHEINTPLGVIRAASENITSAFTSSLQQMPPLLQRCTPQQQESFLELVNASLQIKQTLSTREERQLQRQLQKVLTEQKIANADQIATKLILLRLGTDLTPYQAILHNPNCSDLLQVAYQIVLQSQSTNSIRQEVDRAAKIVFALKTYSHQSQSEEKSLIQISDGIEIALTLYHNRLKQGIEVIRNYETVPNLLCDPDALTQVWVNLIDNAIYAIGQQGILEISIAQKEGRVVVEITNSGAGIPIESQSLIFEPFFTTKPRGEGSGLGLDIVRQIVRKHDGNIQVRSQNGRVTFSVTIPLPEVIKH